MGLLMGTTQAELTRLCMARKRRQARELGFCTRCCKEKPNPGLTTCASCNAAALRRNQRKRKRDREMKEQHRFLVTHEDSGDKMASRHLYEGAAQYYQEALNTHVIVQADHIRVSGKLAKVLQLSNDPNKADSWYDRILTSYLSPSSEGLNAVEVLFEKSLLLWVSSQTEAMLPILSEAVRIAELHDNVELGKNANILLANTLIMLARYNEAEGFLAAVGKVTENDSVNTRIRFWMQKGTIAATYGHEIEALEDFDRAVAALKDDPSVYHATSVWENYGDAAAMLGQTDSAKACYERALLAARRNNIVWRIPQLCLQYAQSLLRMGQYALAYDYLLDALSYDAKAPILDVFLSSVGIPLALHMKDEALLARCAQPRAIELAFMSAEPARIGQISAAFANLYVETGHGREARELLHRAVMAMRDAERAWNLPIEIARHGAMEDISSARRLLEMRVSRPCAAVAEAHLVLFDAFVARRQGCQNIAHAKAGDAANRFKELRWMAYADLAHSLLPAGQRHPPKIEAISAVPFSNTGATLTKREREVAALVLKGFTSRLIAEQLSISAHTVDSHVNSIMNRLGIHSRHELAYVLVHPIQRS